MIKEALNEVRSQKDGLKWVGGSDAYKDMKEIEKLILSYDFHYARIDDGAQYKKAEKANRDIVKKLKDMGVTAFSNGGMN